MHHCSFVLHFFLFTNGEQLSFASCPSKRASFPIQPQQLWGTGMVSPKHVEYSWTRDDAWGPHTVRGILKHRVISLFIFGMYIYVNWNVFLYNVVLDSLGQLHQSAIGICIPTLSWTSLAGSPSHPSSHHRALRWALCAIEQVPTCYLFYTLRWIYVEALVSIGPPLILSLCPQV